MAHALLGGQGGFAHSRQGAYEEIQVFQRRVAAMARLRNLAQALYIELGKDNWPVV